MTFFRQKIKRILIEKQNKLYRREVLEKNITYDKWITEQEKTSRYDCTIYEYKEKSLINGSITKDFASIELKNAGIISNRYDEIRYLSIVDRNSRENDKTNFVHLNIKNMFENTSCVLEQEKLDYIVLSIYPGQVRENAYQMIREQFQNKNVILVYGDEDVLDAGTGRRRSPWMKPDWSPDRFLSGFYLGGLIAIRRTALKEAYEYCAEHGILGGFPPGEGDSEEIQGKTRDMEWLYLLLYEMLNLQNCFAKRRDGEKEKVCHIKRVLYSSEREGYEQIKCLKLPDFCEDGPYRGEEKRELVDELKYHTLSIIIPSKDHPAVLFRCLDSLLEQTKTACSYEIILVDNGSGEENRLKIEEKVKALNCRTDSCFAGCRYLYEQMDFNFSKMCNLGAENATGQILLFLNDDMEIIRQDWMNLMMKKAVLPYAGAVGVKLLYPDSDIIQHAGVTNLRVGPAHKLQYLSDSQDHYFGMNRGVHNMLAVTGACLMVRKDIFREAGGFCEELAVAFNDVDLCYSIYEKGYYNIVRNDTALYHHESLSRGKDGESEEKQLRHLKEKDLLYERHLALYGRDPFYHPDLLNDMLDAKYSMAYCNQVTLDMPWSKLVSCKKDLERAREDECLVVGMECARDIYRWLYSISPEKGAGDVKPEDMGYYFQGYSFIIGADNACYKKKFLLRNKQNNQILAIEAQARYRQDIESNLPDQRNVGLTGFAAKLPKEAVPAGIYQFGILAQDQCSRQRLINWSNWVMEVEADGRQSVREGKEQGE